MRSSDWSSDVCSSDLAEAQANYDLAVIEAQRAADLFEKQSGTASNRDNTAAQKLKADASLQRARAELKTAEIDLDRTTIRAPIGGAIGLSETTQGALVAAQQTTALTTIRTLDPIFVDVTQSATRSEEHTSELQSLMRISYAVFCLKKKHRKSRLQQPPDP